MNNNSFKRIAPCPFCGGEAESCRIWYWFVQCTKCGATVGLGYSPTDGADGDFETENEAISEWNLRRAAYRGRKLSGEWVYGALTLSCGAIKEVDGKRIVPETLGEYTAEAHTENGERVYEGDIVIVPEEIVIPEEIKEIKGVVVREENKFMLSLEDHSLRDLSDYDYGLRVIGNIHDNPDLFGQE